MSSMGPGLRNDGCVSLGLTCITILDIALHIFIIDDLVSANIDLLWNLLECCCVVEVQIRCKEFP